VTDLHCVASVIDPRQKGNLTLMTTDERDRAVAGLRQMVTDASVQTTQSASSSTTLADTEVEPRSKRQRLSTSDTVADFFMDMFTTTSTTTLNEVKHFLLKLGSY